MPLTKYQLEKCKSLTEKLIAWPLCQPFVEMVDPERDGAPNYLQIIKEPMALQKVLSNLKNGKYDTIEAWKSDVNLIWDNARKYNGEDALYTHMSAEAKLWFNKKVQNFPSSQEEEWMGKMQRASQRFMHCISHPPADIDPHGFITDSVANLRHK